MSKNGKITKANAPKDLGVSGFFGLDPISSAIRASRFDVQEEIETIISLVRDADPKVQLPALKHLRTVLKEVAAANGLFGTVQETRSMDTGQQKVSSTLSTQTLLSNLRKENEHEREQAGYEILNPVEGKKLQAQNKEEEDHHNSSGGSAAQG
jgi:hypothetical protein